MMGLVDTHFEVHRQVVAYPRDSKHLTEGPWTWALACSSPAIPHHALCTGSDGAAASTRCPHECATPSVSHDLRSWNMKSTTALLIDASCFFCIDCMRAYKKLFPRKYLLLILHHLSWCGHVHTYFEIPLLLQQQLSGVCKRGLFVGCSGTHFRFPKNKSRKSSISSRQHRRHTQHISPTHHDRLLDASPVCLWLAIVLSYHSHNVQI